MPELINICLLYPDAQNLPHPTLCIETLSGVLPSWFGKPRNAMLLNWETGEENILPWPIQDQDKVGESEKTILCVYTNSVYNGVSSNSISVELREGSAVYTVSAAMTEVLSHPLGEIEDWIADLFMCLKHFAIPIIAVGSEIELSPTKNETKAVKDAISKFINAFWVVVDSSLLLQNPTEFISVKQLNGSTMFRRNVVLSLLHKP